MRIGVMSVLLNSEQHISIALEGVGGPAVRIGVVEVRRAHTAECRCAKQQGFLRSGFHRYACKVGYVVASKAPFVADDVNHYAFVSAGSYRADTVEGGHHTESAYGVKICVFFFAFKRSGFAVSLKRLLEVS